MWFSIHSPCKRLQCISAVSYETCVRRSNFAPLAGTQEHSRGHLRCLRCSSLYKIDVSTFICAMPCTSFWNEKGIKRGFKEGLRSPSRNSRSCWRRHALSVDGSFSHSGVHAWQAQVKECILVMLSKYPQPLHLSTKVVKLQSTDLACAVLITLQTSLQKQANTLQRQPSHHFGNVHE